MIGRRRALPLLPSLLASIAVACSGVATSPEPATATACTELFSGSRCAAITERAMSQPGVDAAAVVDVLIVPFDPIDEDGNVRVLGGAPPIEVRVVAADGTTRDIVLGCGGIGDPADPVCTDDPRLALYAVGGEGYRDLPCMDPDAGVCATPLPDIDPEAAAAASPIVAGRLEIPIDHKGSYEVRIGEGSLPNGILSESTIQLVDDWPDGVSITDGSVRLEVRSLEPDGRPFDGYYSHGWREGVERIEAVLVFDVTRFEPGAVLAVEDVVVR